MRLPEHLRLVLLLRRAFRLFPRQFGRFFLPTRAVVFVSTRSGCKRFRGDELFLLAQSFWDGKGLLRTRLKIFPIIGSVAPSVHAAACGRQKNITVASLLPAASTISTLR